MSKVRVKIFKAIGQANFNIEGSINDILLKEDAHFIYLKEMGDKLIFVYKTDKGGEEC